MGLATVHSRAQNGLQADPVTVEVDLSPGLPGLSIVGLPEAAVRESRDRVRAAILNSGYQFPNRRITINLAPADLPKEGGRFDLPIALGILAASDQIPAQALQDLEVLGELSLTGEIRPVRGVLPAAIKCSKMGRKLLVPEANVEEALLAGDCELKTTNQLGALCAILHGEGLVSGAPRRPAASAPIVANQAEVRGQFQAKRALEIAAAGAHSLLMCGPPGAGKSMLAVRLPGILPPLEQAEAMEVAAVASISGGGFDPQDWDRAPHHTASGVALVGGGTQPRPGEITLAHHGVLFPDESVRPACAGSAARAAGERPDHGVARGAAGGFSGALPVGRGNESLSLRHYLGDSAGRCRCTPDQVTRYRSRLSGPLLDRIDLQVFVPRLESAELTAEHAPAAENSATVRERVIQARTRQQARAGKANAALTPKELERDCVLDEATGQLLGTALTRLSLSARAHHRVLKVARTIADLAGVQAMSVAHVAEALRYRQFDRDAT